MQQKSLSGLLDNEPPLVRELCYGVLRWYHQLLALSQQLLLKPLKQKDQDILCLLLMGIYQLQHMRVAQHAAVNETLKAIPRKKAWAKGLLNKTLRRFIDEQDTLIKNLETNTAAKYSHPKWLIKQIQSAYPDNWQALLSANNHKAPMTLRVNQLQTTAQQYADELNSASIESSLIPERDCAIQLKTPIVVSKLPGFETGRCSVQDAAGQRVVELMDLQPGQRVLDACAAPGSKTGHILESEPKIKQLVAVDKDPARLTKVADNLCRLQLSCEQTLPKSDSIELIAADVADTQSWWNHPLFDRILIDAPCSATGVIRRHPDIKLLRKASDIDTLVQQQRRILSALWPLLTPDGLCIYTTCSILPAENQHNIDWFLQENVDAEQVSVTNPQQLPQQNGCDGFFYAVIRKLP